MIKEFEQNMSNALQNFIIGLNDAKELMSCFDSINKSNSDTAPKVLKRATLIMVLTAWETYIEDVAVELFNNKFGVLNGCHLGNFMQQQFSIHLKRFHNPDSLKTKKIFQEFFGVDVTEKWTWNNYNDPDQVRHILNKWIKKRGEAVHRAQTDQTKPHIAKRDELDKCLRFFSELVEVTDAALMKV